MSEETMKKLTLLSLLVLLAMACASSRSGPMAMVTLQPTSGQTARGTVHFQGLADGSVEVQVDVTGVPPGVHGFHIHDKGDCGDNGNAAGGHFNPMNMPHASPDAASHHAGDFGNVTADANGEVHTKFNTRSVTVSEGSLSVAGHAVILHANPDDLTTQPTGNAGARIACGVAQSMAASMHP
jgi:superoxide dismutase, Cu-Zn family